MLDGLNYSSVWAIGFPSGGLYRTGEVHLCNVPVHSARKMLFQIVFTFDGRWEIGPLRSRTLLALRIEPTGFR